MAGDEDEEQNLSKTQTLELDPSQALPSASFPVENCDPHLQYEIDRKKETQSRATLDMLFRDFRARRAAIVKALTVEAKEFYKLCDPVEENLCLYGHPDETWEVSFLDNPPEGPPDMPEPPVGLNLARDDMDENEWLALVALHSDAWLLALTFYLWARFSNQEESRKYRGELFSMIDTLPTIYEVVKGAAKKPTNDGTPINNDEPVSKPPSPPEEFSEGSSKRTRVA